MDRRGKGAMAALLPAALMLLAGCCGPRPPAVSPPIRYGGCVEQTLKAPLPAVHAAAVAALRKMDMPLLDDHADDVSGRLVSRRPDGAPVHIALEALGERYTRVTVRVDFDPEARHATQLLGRIRSGAE